ncbi:MAG: hypothetical protein ACXW2U_01590 [Telluria sp.]
MGLLACALALSACAVPELAADKSDAMEAKNAQQFVQEEGELLTGSRIPVKSTTHSMRRTGGKELKSAAGGGQHNPESPNGGAGGR